MPPPPPHACTSAVPEVFVLSDSADDDLGDGSGSRRPVDFTPRDAAGTAEGEPFAIGPAGSGGGGGSKRRRFAAPLRNPHPRLSYTPVLRYHVPTAAPDAASATAVDGVPRQHLVISRRRREGPDPRPQKCMVMG